MYPAQCLISLLNFIWTLLQVLIKPQKLNQVLNLLLTSILSKTLQNQNLSFDETDEQYLRQKMLLQLLAKENIDDKDCLYQWLKNALEQTGHSIF